MLGCAVEPPAEPRPWFDDGTLAAGIDFVHDAGATSEKQLPETMGAGAALVDVDEDGDLDLYFVQSGPLPVGSGLDRSEAAPNRLFLNDGTGHFTDATAASGAAAHRGYGMGVAAGDANGDGHVDLYVTNVGPDALLLGNGTGSFRDGTSAAGLGDPRWNTGAVFFDPDSDGDLDLFVLGYVDVDLEHPPWCGSREPGWRSYCHPDQFEGITDRFWRNDGRGRFEDRTLEAGLADSAGKGLGVATLDFDDDGALDLYVANDSVENRLWRGLGDGTFEDATLLSGTGVDGLGATEAGMGVATGDVDGDGRVDLFVTNFDDESNTLYRNEGQGLFRDVTAAVGLDAPSRLPVGFGTVLVDFDHDGDLDLAVANGHIVDNIELYHDGKSHAQRAQLFENLGERFGERTEAAGALAATPLVGRGLYAGDLDGDGDQDLVLTQCGGPARLFLGQGAATPALRIEGLPVGARLWARFAGGRRIVRDAGSQGSYLGASAPAVLLAAGGEAVVGLELRLPGGERRTVELPFGEEGSGGRYRIELGAEGGRLVPLGVR